MNSDLKAQSYYPPFIPESSCIPGDSADETLNDLRDSNNLDLEINGLVTNYNSIKPVPEDDTIHYECLNSNTNLGFSSGATKTSITMIEMTCKKDWSSGEFYFDPAPSTISDECVESKQCSSGSVDTSNTDMNYTLDTTITYNDEDSFT